MPSDNGPSSITATLSYFTPPPNGEPAYIHTSSTPNSGVRPRNYTSEPHATIIENVRGHEDEYTLDTAGFQYFTRAAKHTAFRDTAAVEREYYPESIELIKELTGASRVVLFDHTIRRRNPAVKEDTPEKRQPVAQVHVDQTPASAVARVHRHLPAADAPALLTRRFQIINLWRPISHTAVDWPLALCDYRSIDTARDLVPVALIYPDRKGETFGVRHDPGHRWKYKYAMRPDEGVLIKCFDSVDDGSVAVLTPHTGFEDPTTPAGTPYRESIELRALVFYD